MKLLILGGTVFLGRHLVDSALAAGHEVTLFNRGQHNPDLYSHVEKLRGDRSDGLEALHGRRWDAVIDTSGYVPRAVQASAELLAGAVEHYTFVSSISVYADVSRPGVDESSRVATMEDETVEEITGETYGPLKALSERAVETALPGRSLVIRPGLIVGPCDPTDRFTYWPHRVASGGDVLAPGDPEAPVQIVDGRDLAEWTLRMVEDRRTGVFNASGPDYRLTMERLLDRCRTVSGSDARYTWVEERFLLDQGIIPWTELPLWVPGGDSLMEVDCSKAIAAGLTFRPLDQTIRDTLSWDATRGPDHQWRAGLAPAREREVLAAWLARA